MAPCLDSRCWAARRLCLGFLKLLPWPPVQTQTADPRDVTLTSTLGRLSHIRWQGPFSECIISMNSSSITRETQLNLALSWKGVYWLTWAEATGKCRAGFRQEGPRGSPRSPGSCPSLFSQQYSFLSATFRHWQLSRRSGLQPYHQRVSL